MFTLEHNAFCNYAVRSMGVLICARNWIAVLCQFLASSLLKLLLTFLYLLVFVYMSILNLPDIFRILKNIEFCPEKKKTYYYQLQDIYVINFSLIGQSSAENFYHFREKYSSPQKIILFFFFFCGAWIVDWSLIFSQLVPPGNLVRLENKQKSKRL